MDSVKLNLTHDSIEKYLNKHGKDLPLSLLCGFLSKAAVLDMLDRTFDRLVFPESTCPNNPILMFNGMIKSSTASTKKLILSDCVVNKKSAVSNRML